MRNTSTLDNIVVVPYIHRALWPQGISHMLTLPVCHLVSEGNERGGVQLAGPAFCLIGHIISISSGMP